jgi:hypothetical protein
MNDPYQLSEFLAAIRSSVNPVMHVEAAAFIYTYSFDLVEKLKSMVCLYQPFDTTQDRTDELSAVFGVALPSH